MALKKKKVVSSVASLLNSEVTQPNFSLDLMLDRVNDLKEFLEAALIDKEIANDTGQLFNKVRSVFDATFYRPSRLGKKLAIYPSGFFYSCKRALYYEHTFVTPSNPENSVISPELNRIFRFGDMIHFMVQSTLSQLGVLITAEGSIIDEELRLRGRYDAVIQLNSLLYVLEIKSIDGFQYVKLNNPYGYHIEQLNLYMGKLEIPRGVLVYVSKSTGEIKEFEIEFNKTLYNESLEMISEFNKAVQDKEVPMRICTSLKSTSAKSCKFCQHCFNF